MRVYVDILDLARRVMPCLGHVFCLANVIVAIGVFSCARADEFDPVRMIIKKAIDERQVPSLTLAVSRDGKLLWSEAFGWADREANKEATPQTAYCVGSVSKPIIATCCMLLRARGLLDLDHPGNEYLGEAQLVAKLGDASKATVRSLLHHTSGLGSYYQTFFTDELDRPPPIDLVICRYGQLVRSPGEQFHYSNLGYGVLGRIAELRSGRPVSKLLREELFLPLQMEHSSLGIDANVAAGRAARYGRDGKRLLDYQASPDAAADVWSSAVDLVRFGQLHCPDVRGGQAAPILSADDTELMRTDLVQMARQQYGFGWVVMHDNAGRLRLRHGGAGAGVGAELTVLPAERLVTAVLVNADTSKEASPTILPTRIADAILKTCLPQSIESSNSHMHAVTQNAERFKAFDGFTGSWQGTIETYQGPRQLACIVKSPVEAEVRLSSGTHQRLRQPTFDGRRLKGRFPGNIGVAEAERRRYELELDVALDGDRLCGSITAISVDPMRGEALPFWVELRRKDH